MANKDEYSLLANGRMGDWYVEIEENKDTGEKWLLIFHPDVRPGDVRILLADAEEVGRLISALWQARIDMGSQGTCGENGKHSGIENPPLGGG